MFTNILEVKKNAYRQFGATKYKLKAIKFGNKPWALKQKQKWNSKIDEKINKYLYNWIMYHSQVVRSTIVNDCLKVKIYGHAEPQLVTKKIFQVSFREIHSNLVSTTSYVGLKGARDEDDDIIINYSTSRSLLPPHFKNVTKIQDLVWLQMLQICQNYIFVITVMA